MRGGCLGFVGFARGELSGWMADLDGNPAPGFALNLNSRAVAGQLVRVVGIDRDNIVIKLEEGS